MLFSCFHVQCTELWCIYNDQRFALYKYLLLLWLKCQVTICTTGCFKVSLSISWKGLTENTFSASDFNWLKNHFFLCTWIKLWKQIELLGHVQMNSSGTETFETVYIPNKGSDNFRLVQFVWDQEHIKIVRSVALHELPNLSDTALENWGRSEQFSHQNNNRYTKHQSVDFYINFPICQTSNLKRGKFPHPHLQQRPSIGNTRARARTHTHTHIQTPRVLNMLHGSPLPCDDRTIHSD